MLDMIKKDQNIAFTENGAVSYSTTLSDCLDLFSTIGALRNQSEQEIISRFKRAYAENADIAMKILFFGRDVRGGLGERRVFRIITKWLSKNEPQSLKKNIALISEYGRFDDLVALIGTPCEADAIAVIKAQLDKDMSTQGGVSLLAKWLPSVNASSKETVLNAKRIARLLGMNDKQYRTTLSFLRSKIAIIENDLRLKDYSFDYSAVPSKALFKYRKAFSRNDSDRYGCFLENVRKGTAAMHTGTLMPYDIIAPCFYGMMIREGLSAQDRAAMDTTWNALEDFGGDENALVVVDGSGSMYSGIGTLPITVALSLGIYFAQRNKGVFHNHFITFSETPRLIEIKGRDIAEKVRYCADFNEVANTNLAAVFELILNTAVNNGCTQEDMPKKLYIVSDMEFDWCVDDCSATNFEYAKRLFRQHGYKLPEIIFWNVQSRNRQQPVTMNEEGVALVSGCNPRLFSMVAGGITSPAHVMMDVLSSPRYEPISA